MKSIIKQIIYFILYFSFVIATFGTDNSEFILVVLCLSLMLPIFYLVNDRYKQKQHIDYEYDSTVIAGTTKKNTPILNVKTPDCFPHVFEKKNLTKIHFFEKKRLPNPTFLKKNVGLG